jgi:hypothetical protein
VWCAGTWLIYAATSRNYSGANCCVRWFVPLLAPAYFALAILVREAPRYRPDLVVLSGWGAVLMGVAWCYGPWIPHMVPALWPIEAAALVSWGWLAWRRRGEKGETLARPERLLVLSAKGSFVAPLCRDFPAEGVHPTRSAGQHG